MSYNYNQSQPGPVIQHSTHVPVIKSTSSGTAVAIISAVLSFAGVIPWIAFFEALMTDELRFMNQVGLWVLVSGAPLSGLIIALTQLKVKGYQSQQNNIIMWVLIGFAVLMLALPVVSAALYGSGIGN